MPRCADCGEDKPAEEFPRNRSQPSGRHCYCKPCNNARSRESKHRLHGNGRHYHLVGRYGIGADDVKALVAKQGGICPICRRREPTHVDHDHATGKVRAILCGPCNTGLGQFKDDPVRIRAAIEYLQKHSEVPR
ncbi:MAG: recombinase [Actinobacteria bacterium]|nr:recombinase [Actinomycetota bacterium]